MIEISAIVADPSAYDPDGEYIFDSETYFQKMNRRSNAPMLGAEAMVEMGVETAVEQYTLRYRKGKITREEAIAGLANAQKVNTGKSMKTFAAVCLVVIASVPIISPVLRHMLNEQWRNQQVETQMLDQS